MEIIEIYKKLDLVIKNIKKLYKLYFRSVEMRMAKGEFSICSLFGEFLLLGK